MSLFYIMSLCLSVFFFPSFSLSALLSEGVVVSLDLSITPGFLFFSALLYIYLSLCLLPGQHPGVLGDRSLSSYLLCLTLFLYIYLFLSISYLDNIQATGLGQGGGVLVGEDGLSVLGSHAAEPESRLYLEREYQFIYIKPRKW